MAFLGIRIPQETGRLLSCLEVPGNKEGSSEYHITLLCFEDNWPISEVSKSIEATHDIISKTKPFMVSVNEITCFPKRADNPVPIIAKVESKELHDLRGKLVKSFDKNKIEFSKLHKDFKPHITLSYAEEEIDDYDISPVKFMVQELVLWCGDHGDDRLFVTFPLQGPEKHALLMQKADLFCKLANNPQPYFTQSYERRKTER